MSVQLPQEGDPSHHRSHVAPEADQRQTIEERALANAGLSDQSNRSGVGGRAVSFHQANNAPTAAASDVAMVAIASQDAEAPRVGHDFSTVSAAAPAVHDVTTFSAINDGETSPEDAATEASSGSTKWFFVEMVVRVLAFPIISWKESLVGCTVPPLGSKVMTVCSILSSAIWLVAVIFMGVTASTRDEETDLLEDRSTMQHGVHIALSVVLGLCTITMNIAVIHRRLWNPRSYLVRNPERLNFWPFLLIVWLRVLFEGLQLAVLPLLFIPLSKAREGNSESVIGTMADSDGLRYKVVNGILLRAFPSNSTWWSSNDNQTGFSPRDAGDEATYDLYWPLCVLVMWMVSLSFNGMLQRRRAYLTCPTMASTKLGRGRAEIDHTWFFSDGFYKGLLLLQNQVFDVNGPLAVMLLMAATQFLVYGYNRDPKPDSMTTPAYQGLGVWFGMATLSTFYLQPKMVYNEVTNVDCIEMPLFQAIRSCVKALYVCCVVMIGLVGEHEDNNAVRATLIALLACAVHVLLGSLSVFLRPSPRDGINATMLISHVAGVFIAIITIVQTHASSERTQTEGPGAILISAGILIAGIIGGFAIYQCKIRKPLPDDAATIDGQDRRGIVSGLRLFSATQADDFKLCGKQTVVQVLWRPMEPLLNAASTPDSPNHGFIATLLHASFIPANVGAPASWTISVLVSVQHLAPSLSQAALLHALSFTTQFVNHFAASTNDSNSPVLLEGAMTRCRLLEAMEEATWVIAFKRRAISICGTESPILAHFPARFNLADSEHLLARLEALCAVATGLRMEAEALHYMTSPKATEHINRISTPIIGHFYTALESCGEVFAATTDSIFNASAKTHHKKCLICVREAWLDTFYCLYGCDGGRGMPHGSFTTRSLLREYKQWKRGEK